MYLTLIYTQTDCQNCWNLSQIVQCIGHLSVPSLPYPPGGIPPGGPCPLTPVWTCAFCKLSPGTSYIRPLISWMPYCISFHCFCNELPQTNHLKTTQIYYLLVLEVRILKRVSLGWNKGVGRVALLLQTLREKRIHFLALSSFSRMSRFLGSWRLSSTCKVSDLSSLLLNEEPSTPALLASTVLLIFLPCCQLSSCFHCPCGVGLSRFP